VYLSSGVNVTHSVDVLLAGGSHSADLEKQINAGGYYVHISEDTKTNSCGVEIVQFAMGVQYVFPFVASNGRWKSGRITALLTEDVAQIIIDSSLG